MLTSPEREFPHFAALDNLPSGYRQVYQLDLESQRVLVLLNVIGLVLLGVGIVLFWGVDRILVAAGVPSGFNPLKGATPLGMALVILFALLAVLSLHELCHGLAFQFFGARPRYGFNLRKGVAFASADRYYLTRDAYLIVGLAPLVVISLFSVVLMALVGGELRTVIELAGAMNFGGAVGDMWFAIVCRRYPWTLLVRDFGDGAELLLRDSTSLDHAFGEVDQQHGGDTPAR
jgi:hypothetical protein